MLDVASGMQTKNYLHTKGCNRPTTPLLSFHASVKEAEDRELARYKTSHPQRAFGNEARAKGL